MNDIDVKDPKKYFEFTAPNVSGFEVKVYMLKKALEYLKTGEIPQRDNFSLPGAYYYADTNGKYSGYGVKAYFFLAPEIVNYLASDYEFVKRAINENVTWWLPENILNTFIF